ncbi:MAG: TrbI/VirB10 family protein [Plesiomonas shigelloides]
MRNDGVIEVNGSAGKSKKLIILLSVCAAVFVVLAVIVKLLPGGKEDVVAQAPANESLQRTTLEEKGLESRLKEIVGEAKRKQAAEQTAEKEKKRLADEAKQKEAAEQAERERLAAEQQKSAAAEQIRQNHANQSQSSNSNSQEDRPLPKHLRVLGGETLVKLDNTQTPPPQNADSDDFLKGGSFANGSVSVIKNRKWLLSAGTSLSCVLKTKIVTAYPGVTMCQLTKDVYSDNGEMLLARAGSMLIGEQKQAVSQGMARVFVTWTNIKDGNINVRIDALGADGLGASGLPAWIDNHFWERFGSTMLLSFIDDALAAASTHLAKTGASDSNAISFDNTNNAGQKMAEIALENSINIPPTAYINQGELLTVIVPRNIDFSSVYETR